MPRIRRRHPASVAACVLAASVACLLGGATAAAQDDPAPLPAGPSADDRLEEAERLAPREPGEIEAFSPATERTTDPVRPGLTSGADWLNDPAAEAAGSGLLPERTFINRVRGRVLRGPYDTLIFAPDPDQPLVIAPRPAAVEPAADTTAQSDDATEPAEDTMRLSEDATEQAETVPTRAVLLLPNGVLERFDEYVLAGEPQTRAIVTGQVFRYGERNYVLPTMMRRALPGSAVQSVVSPPDSPPDSTIDPQAAPSADAVDVEADPLAETGRPSPEMADDPDIEALIADLERRPPYAPATRSPAAPAEPDGQADQAASPPITEAEGRYIAGVRGRMVRSTDGTWLFVLDNDLPTSKHPAAYTLLPCRTLQAIEGVGLRQDDSAAGLISGRVYSFRGRLFLLPTLYQRERREGVDPLQ